MQRAGCGGPSQVRTPLTVNNLIASKEEEALDAACGLWLVPQAHYRTHVQPLAPGGKPLDTHFIPGKKQGQPCIPRGALCSDGDAPTAAHLIEGTLVPENHHRGISSLIKQVTPLVITWDPRPVRTGPLSRGVAHGLHDFPGPCAMREGLGLQLK